MRSPHESAPSRIWITFDDRELVEVLPEVVDAQGEPFGSTSIAAQWFVMREARRAGVKVMLDGQGGDETLAGYARQHRSYRFGGPGYAGRPRRRPARAAAQQRLPPRAAAVALTTPFLPGNLRWRSEGPPTGAEPPPRTGTAREDDATCRAAGRAVSGSAPAAVPPHPRSARLPELLRYEDRNSMAHSLEARVPFLDHRLVELLYGVDAELLAGDGTTKVILRRALADLLPPEVRDRRDKLGFVTPEVRFLRGRLGDLVEETLSSRAARSRGFVDVDEALRRLRTVRNGGAAGFELWRAASVELWARAYLD